MDTQTEEKTEDESQEKEEGSRREGPKEKTETRTEDKSKVNQWIDKRGTVEVKQSHQVLNLNL